MTARSKASLAGEASPNCVLSFADNMAAATAFVAPRGMRSIDHARV